MPKRKLFYQFKSNINQKTSTQILLLFRNENGVDRIKWISACILEIYHAYGGQSIPSIAIFLPDDYMDQFAKQLGKIDA